ncbi:hypothetical protein D3C73_1131620 [compost metagenome]
MCTWPCTLAVRPNPAKLNLSSPTCTSMSIFMATGGLPSSVCWPMITASSESLTVDGGNSRTVMAPRGTRTLPATANSSPFMEIVRSGSTSSLA